MIVEGRKRDAAANALLALSFAANAAQSPQALVRSGHIEGPGIQLMSRMMTKRKEADRNLDSGRVSHPARNRKKKTFKEFVEEIELLESSSGERGTRRLPSRGPSSDRFERNKQRNVSSSNAALKKAGFKRSTKYMSGTKGRPTKWTETSTSSHHGTETGTYANQSDYAARATIKRGATSTRVSKLKRIRAQLGGDRTSRPVHDVAVVKKRTFNDTPSSTMTKGRSFRQEVTKGVPDNLKKAGAKAGDIVTSTPTSGSRSRMYGKTHNTKTDSRTGMTVNRVREAFDILEVNRPESGSDEEKARWDKVRATIDARENPSDWIVGVLGRDKDGVQRYGIKNDTSRRNQQKNRASRLKDVDSDLDPKQKSRGDTKASIIKGRGKEHHHLTPISQSSKEFKGLTPEQRREKREQDAKFGKFHGSDPRNIAQTEGPKGGKGIPHRGADGYHSSQKPVGKGGSIQDIGSGAEIVAARRRVERQGSASEKLAKEKGVETPKMQKQRELRARMSAYAKASGYN